MRRLASFSAAALAVYLALAAAVFVNTWTTPTQHWIGGGPDPPLFIWHLRWLPFALGDGHNPFLSDYLNYPDGFNLMWNTSVLFPALLLAPVTLVVGVVFSYNVLVTLSLALSGWCAYLVFRRYVRSREAAAIGGLLYGFSPFMFAQALGHPHMTLAVYPPLVLLLLDEIVVRQRRSPTLLGAVLGLATALQLLTGEEIVAISFLVACVGVLLLVLLWRNEARPRIGYAAGAITVAGASAGAIAAYPLWIQLSGEHRVSGPIQPHGVFVLDLLQFVVPGPRQELTLDSTNDLFARFTGSSELGGYLGLPLLLLAVFVIVRHWSDRLVRFVGLLLGAVVVLSLGPRLHVAGEVLPVPLPWVIPQRLPLLDNILPARLALVMFLLVGLLVAVFVDRWPHRGRGRQLALVAVVVAVIPLLPSLPYPSDADDTPAFFADGARMIPKDSVALIAPFASPLGGTSRPMVWQAEADMRFRMPEGYIIRPSGSFESMQKESPLFVRMISIQSDSPSPPLSASARRASLCQLDRLDVRAVVVGPMEVGRAETVALFRNLLGDVAVSVGGVELWPEAALLAARRGARRCT